MLSDGPAYVIVGKGRWGTRMRAMLAAEGRQATFATDIRQKTTESANDYESRMAEAFVRSQSHIAWLCLPPGPHVPPLIRATIAAGLHVIVEKPWVYSREETREIQDAATQAKLSTAVNFEYCLLSEVQDWRSKYRDRTDLRFGGAFRVSAEDHLDIPATQNLGCHLVAMQQYAVPHAEVSTISCAYQSNEERRIWLDDGSDGRVAEIDFLRSKEPIIQRFLVTFERTLDGTGFPFDLEFGLRVEEKLAESVRRDASFES